MLWVWVAGSLTMGVGAFLLTRSTLLGGGPSPLFVVVCAAIVLFAVLGWMGWRWSAGSWLPDEARGRLLWAALVGAVGLAGWGFAAATTFGAGFSTTAQAVLAIPGSGLPFALVAMLLLKPPRVNAFAMAASVILLLVGYLLVAVRLAGTGEVSVPQLYLQYLEVLLDGGPIAIPM
ncbi:hypothetical protein HUW46_01848 [Amycolatopsis sp. CA-230715]|nr:hypothetical protein HUW46_01848 [Amycolatopsis sp. CA-230715]